MASEDSEYYRTRALDERQRAAAATSPDIARIHVQLAEKYEALMAGCANDATAQPDEDGFGQPQFG